MIKTVITQLYIAFCLICFFACEKQKEELLNEYKTLFRIND